MSDDEDVFTELVCGECGVLFASYRPSREAVETPQCPQCKSRKREGCEEIGTEKEKDDVRG